MDSDGCLSKVEGYHVDSFRIDFTHLELPERTSILLKMSPFLNVLLTVVERAVKYISAKPQIGVQ